MPQSLNKIGVIFGSTTQDRAKKTFDDLSSAALELVNSGDPSTFTSRMLSNRAGYALGTLVKHLKKVENIFLWAIVHGRTENINRFRLIIEQHPSNLPLQSLIEQLVDTASAEIKRVNPKVIRFFQSKAYKRTDSPWELNAFTDVLADPWLQATQSNQTGTFRVMSKEEAKWALRTALVFVEHPFVENNPIAGTVEHRNLAISNLVRLFGI